MQWQRICDHLDFLYDLALRETGHRHDAEDIVHDVAVSALRARSPRRPRAYLAGAVLRRVRHVRRSDRRRRRREAEPPAVSSAPAPDRAALVRDEVERTLAALSEEDRRAVTLRHLYDLGYEEIAETLGLSVEAARQRVHRARQRLRRRFGESGAAVFAALPIATAPASLTKPPLLAGVLFMNTATKAAVAALALAAGAATGAATASRPEPAPVELRVATRAAPAAPDAGPGAEVTGLEAELAAFPALAPADLVVYAHDTLRGRLAAIDSLPEKDRRSVAMRLGEQIHKTGEGLDEALDLLRRDSDPRVLFWLATVLRTITLNSEAIPDETREELAPLALSGEPAERRRAAVGLCVGRLYQRATPAWHDALTEILATERDPRVLRMAAEGLIFAWIDTPKASLLAAYARMDPGDDRRRLAISFRRWATFPEVARRYDEARDESERADWVRVLGYKLGEGKSDEERVALVRAYRQTRDVELRAWLALRWIDNRSTSDLAPLAEIETDAKLRALLERCVGLSQADARKLLREFSR